MSHRKDLIIGVGAATWDELWRVDAFSDQEVVSEASDYTAMGGGPVATALCVMSKLGHRTVLIDSCGEDEVGRKVLADLERWQVGTDLIQVHPEAASARAVILVRAADGARQIFFKPASLAAPKLTEEMRKSLSQARLLHLNGRHESLARDLVAVAQSQGVEISFDGGAGRYRDSLRDLVEASHLRIVSREFAERYTGSSDIQVMMAGLLRSPARIVVITAGADGCYWAERLGDIHHQKPEPISPVDTTGCGDVFHGAFLHGWIHGWPMERCADFANSMASANALGLGGRYVLSACPELFSLPA